jgi:hypothetical protein
MIGQSKYSYERLCNGEVQGELETTQPVSVQQVKTVYPETTGLRLIGCPFNYLVEHRGCLDDEDFKELGQ